MLPVHYLPEVLDARWILADDQGRQVLDGTDNGACMPFQCRFSPTVEPGLVREHLDKNQLRIRALRMSAEA